MDETRIERKKNPRVMDVASEDRRLIVCEVGNMFGIGKSSVQ